MQLKTCTQRNDKYKLQFMSFIRYLKTQLINIEIGFCDIRI